MKYYGLFLFLLSSIAFSKVDSFKEKSKNKSAKILGIDSIQLESKMRVRVVESDNLKSRVFGYIFGIKVRVKVNKETALFFDGMMSLETGSNNEVSSQSEFSPVDTVDLNEGGIMYSPFSFFSTSPLCKARNAVLLPRPHNSTKPVDDVWSNVDDAS